MFFAEHAPPHFHAQYGVAINGLTVLDGMLPRRALELVLDWAELHHKELLDGRPRFTVRSRTALKAACGCALIFFTVFEALKTLKVFQRLAGTDGSVSWPGDLDLAPDAMYEAIRREGE